MARRFVVAGLCRLLTVNAGADETRLCCDIPTEVRGSGTALTVTQDSTAARGGRHISRAIFAVASGLLLIAVSPSNLHAVTRPSAGQVDKLVARLQHHYQTTTSFNAKFDETITRASAPPLRRTGVIYYQKTGKLRWEFEGAQPETIVSDGTTIYDYDPELNQVVETPLTQAFKGQPLAAFLLGAGNLKRDFTVTPLSANYSDSLQHLELISKAGGHRLEVGVDPKTNNIGALTVSDSIGNKTELHFSDIILNQPPKAALFEFTPPDGADIVKGEQGR